MSRQAIELLEADESPVGVAIGALLESGEIVAATRHGEEEKHLALAPFARAESGLAARLVALAAGVDRARVARTFGLVDWGAVFGWLRERHGQMLAPEQQKQALLEKLPSESAVQFQGAMGKFPGIGVATFGDDQKKELQKVLMALVEPYRKEDQEEALECLQRQGGLDKCSLAFYREGDIGNDGEWDNWRLEGPSFVWYFRGYPHVHVWVNVADDASVKLNAQG